jgi:excinuclease ABC subunit A
MGPNYIDKVISIDQSPIGARASGYTTFNLIRGFCRCTESKCRGYNAGRFSFNIKGKGARTARRRYAVEMQFYRCHRTLRGLPRCSIQPRGARNQFKTKNIAQVLDDGGEALRFFSFPKIKKKLETLHAVGYIKMSQRPLSGRGTGETGRKLSRRATGRTLYILDEPTTGLSFDDTAALLRVMQRLVDGINRVSHNLDA